ncbi:2-amino-4-hydroxy-6-hydroxymethyldihydropteridine pyrophosphokinase [Paenibacillus sp. J31TS4]|uniref:2-amino-4-hydroxy-6- hydroxymethyldihydropteridine diphosphokinase n=1 Tax=Paenibacillus sp. J31TS4 TaxID=2807195 RepID=UPI001B211AB6|nr:2-amino-4-hydroxy-6-hydroxymethyldihydropteridine diphosphokinase [Paenibacillus sp. J31TS4]GIP41322.1 2-amino-4-hydroxy-6-hydroxymethyldihydropteridine pyrophosphokinase [Paenibacillus sp. J31TS4]
MKVADTTLHRAFIGLGSNMGDRGAYLAQALRQLGEHPGICVESCSRVYETDPVGFVEQGAFLNMVARLATGLSPLALLDVLQETEARLGRKREIRWGPRTIDLDLLLYDKLQLETERLLLPHPRMGERAFVLVPLADVADISPEGPEAWLAHALEEVEGKEGISLWKNSIWPPGSGPSAN